MRLNQDAKAAYDMRPRLDVAYWPHAACYTGTMHLHTSQKRLTGVVQGGMNTASSLRASSENDALSSELPVATE